MNTREIAGTLLRGQGARSRECPVRLAWLCTEVW